INEHRRKLALAAAEHACDSFHSLYTSRWREHQLSARPEFSGRHQKGLHSAQVDLVARPLHNHGATAEEHALCHTYPERRVNGVAGSMLVWIGWAASKVGGRLRRPILPHVDLPVADKDRTSTRLN